MVRREPVLDPHHDRARAIGLRTRSALTRKYAEYDASQRGDAHRLLDTEQAAGGPRTHRTSSPTLAGAVVSLKEPEARGPICVVLRMQWYDLTQDRVLRTLELFRNEVLPVFR